MVPVLFWEKNRAQQQQSHQFGNKEEKMAFEGLSSRLQDITRKIKGEARITESNMKDMLREVKLALLEADVNYKIVKEFIATIQEKALGQDVMKSLKPGEQVVKIVRDELVELLGGTDSKINISPNPPTVTMLVGLPWQENLPIT